METIIKGHKVLLLDAREWTDFDEGDGGRWVTFCETHGTFCQHATRQDARSWVRDPGMWCEEGDRS